MKYAVFFFAFAIGVPFVSFISLISSRARSWVLTAIVFATCLGDSANINFLSMETYRGPDRGLEVTLADLLTLGLTLALILRFPRRLSWWPYNTAPMLCFFLINGASALWAPEPLLSVFTLFKLMRGYGLYFCVANSLRTGTPLRAVWRGLLLMAGYLSLLVLRQKYGMGMYRVTGTFDHPNPFANFLNLFMPMLLAFGLSDKTLSPVAMFVTIFASLTMLFCEVMTYSRTVIILGAVCAAGVLAFANLRHRSGRVAIATLILSLGALVGGALVARRVLERFESAPEASALARQEFNQAAVMMVLDHPFGVGANQFSLVLTNNERYNRHITVMKDEKQKGVCHHIYLLTLAETGYPGLFFFLLIIARFGWRAAFFALRTPGVEGLLQAAIFLGTVSLHLAGLLEWVFRVTPVLFGYLLCSGVSIGLADLERRRLSQVARNDQDE